MKIIKKVLIKKSSSFVLADVKTNTKMKQENYEKNIN